MLKGSKKNSQLSIPLVLWSLLKGSSVVASHWEFQIRRCLLRTAAKHVLQLCWLPVERNWTLGPSDGHDHGDGFGITIWGFFHWQRWGCYGCYGIQEFNLRFCPYFLVQWGLDRSPRVQWNPMESNGIHTRLEPKGTD